MPKIIENLDILLAAEARRQIEEYGYGAMTIRSVAKACGVGTGTVYNYYSSKDAMVAAYMLADWQQCIAAIDDTAAQSDTPKAVLKSIYDQLGSYAQRHSALFADKDAAAGFTGTFSRYHALLRGQLAKPLRKFCSSDFAAEFIAESLLTWTLSGKNFDEIYDLVNKIF